MAKRKKWSYENGKMLSDTGLFGCFFSQLKLLFSSLITAISAPPPGEAVSKLPKSRQVTWHQMSPSCSYLLLLMRMFTLNPIFPKDALQRKCVFLIIY